MNLPLYLHLYLPTSLPTYIYIWNTAQLTQLDSTRNSTTYLPTSTYLHLHMKRPRSTSPQF